MKVTSSLAKPIIPSVMFVAAILFVYHSYWTRGIGRELAEIQEKANRPSQRTGLIESDGKLQERNALELALSKLQLDCQAANERKEKLLLQKVDLGTALSTHVKQVARVDQIASIIRSQGLLCSEQKTVEPNLMKSAYEARIHPFLVAIELPQPDWKGNQLVEWKLQGTYPQMLRTIQEMERQIEPLFITQINLEECDPESDSHYWTLRILI